ncbi:MAG: 4Fe-4S ferredoxin [Promethearchaeota archaeon]|nr:MAG: 4Fe-4S ferredoxin [Candidatus Lokiarchaeota archaeon]
MGIEEENQKIEKSIRDIARDLLKNKEVDVIIGYTEGTVPLSTSPIIIRDEKDVDKLVWNNFCYINLAKYLAPRMPQLVDPEKGELKVGIVTKGCVGRALIQLAIEKQINLDNVKIIGIPCNGIVNRRRIEKEIGEKEILEVSVSEDNIIVKGKNFEESFPFSEYINELCKQCKIKSPPKVDSCVGECGEYESVFDEFNDVKEFESKTPDEKWEYINDLLSTCTRCYACREACPMCYCNLCFVDQNKPIWFGKTTDQTEILMFHLIRAMHMAGRCVACGACSSVCPVGIDLNLITRKLEQMVKERYNFTSGIDIDKFPPMMDFEMEDEQEFMLEED